MTRTSHSQAVPCISPVRAIAQIALVLLAFASAPAQTPQTLPVADPAPFKSAVPVVGFAFDRPGLPIPNYILTIAQDGSGQYVGDEIPTLPGASPSPTSPAPAPQPFGRPFAITPKTAGKIIALAHDLHNFNVTCASNAKNIADTGKKRLSYSGPDGQGECTYNHTENKQTEAITEILQAIAETMDQGRRLDLLHRYDRLGLDDATAYLTDEVARGRALEVGTIAPSLRSIADDAEVIQRVRARARALLATVPADLQSQ